jgi:predicted ATPase
MAGRRREEPFDGAQERSMSTIPALARLRTLRLAGFKSIRDTGDGLSFRPLNVFVGANGAGKSNLLSFFRLLNFAMTGRLQDYVQRSGGANRLLHFGAKQTREIEASLALESKDGANTYAFRLFYAAGDSLVFADETATFQRFGGPPVIPRSLGGAHRESRLPAEAEAGSTTARYLEVALRRWNHFHFHDTSDEAPIKQQADVDDNRYLRSNGSNLASFLYFLQERHAAALRQVRDTVRLAAPFFDDFILAPDQLNPGVIKLRWREVGHDREFDAFDLSDGTLRFIALTTMLRQPNPPDLVVIDEPELGLHPFALGLLASMLRELSHRTQVIASTQSVTLIDQLDPEDVVVVDRHRGETTFTRHPKDALDGWLEDYSLGEIWQKNLIGGRPTR